MPLFRLGRKEHFASKTFLSRAGEPCERVHLVLSGVARYRYAYGRQYYTTGFSQLRRNCSPTQLVSGAVNPPSWI